MPSTHARPTRARSNPRIGIAGYAVLAGFALGTLSACAPAEATSPPPNIVYILADDLGYGELGSYGQTQIRTPNLDRLADQGMRFTQHYSGSPVCAPSRATLMSGMHTGHNLIKDNFELGGWTDEEERGQMPLPTGSFTIGRMLQDVGYTTAAIGKWGLGGPGSTGAPNDQGFDLFYGYLDQKQAHNYYPTHLWRNEVWDTLANPYFSPHQRFDGDDPTDQSQYEKYAGRDYAQDLMAEEALGFIRENQDNPFFLYLPFPVPHLALQVPEESVDEYDGAFGEEEPYLGDRSYLPHRRPLAAYAAMISRMDGQIGQIVDLIDELGLGENTLIIFTSDNGTTYTGGVDAAFFEATAGLRGLKGSVYEGGIRVPMIARWTGQIEAGAVSDHISAFWDMVPTFAELAGASHPAGIDGVSMVPTLLGTGEQADHDALYWEYHGLWNGAQAVRMGKWKAVRLGGHENADAPIELYDMESDRGETADVAAEYPDVVAAVRAVMEDRTPSEVERWVFAGSWNGG